MKKFEELFKQEFLNELNAPDQNKSIKEKIGIEENPNPVHAKKGKSDNFLTKLLAHKKILIAAMSMLIIVVLGVIGTTSYIQYKNTPVYEGMEATAISNVQPRTVRKKNIGRDLISFDDEELDNAIINDIQPEIPEGIAYYATKGETIEVTVKISNPQFFEILSFTLNGRLYQTYEFKEGSNSEQITVDFTCQDQSGLQTITIDAIKYVDGTEIRDARFEADRTITIGVKYEEVPVVSNLSEIIETTYFGLSFVITDVNNLADPETGLIMYVYDGKSIINRSPLNLGINVFPFSNLHMGETYQYAIVAVYDQLDGRGKSANVLAKNEFTTKEGLDYSNIETTYDSVKVDFDEIHKEGVDIVDINLVDGENSIKGTLNIDGTYSFGSLLSNKEYVLQTTYSYTIVESDAPVTIEKMIETTVKTDVRPTPTVEIINVTPTKEDVSFDFDIQDTLMTEGRIVSINLYQNDILLPITVDVNAKSITGLLSNTSYDLEVVYEYDLKDGNPKQTLSVKTTFKTIEKIAPLVKINEAPMFGSMMWVKFEIIDPDGIFDMENIDDCLVIEVYDAENNLITSTNVFEIYNSNKITGDAEFTITGTAPFRVVAVYSYDLNDGNGVVTIDSNSVGVDNSLNDVYPL